jgi:hypothetical protein
MANSNATYYQLEFPFDDCMNRNKNWESVSIAKKLPHLKSADDTFLIEFMNDGEDFYIKNLNIKILKEI